MCTIRDRQQENQQRGSEFPRYKHIQDNSSFRGPLFQLITLDGSNAPGEPLPRLLLNFFYKFNFVCSIWRNRSLTFWALNKERVVRIAKNYIRDRVYGRHGNLNCIVQQLVGIHVECQCCTEYFVDSFRFVSPCILCEFNSHHLALLFRREKPRIEAHQIVEKVLNEHFSQIDVDTHKALAFHIAGYIAGCYQTEGDEIEKVRQLTFSSIWFCQEFQFAPEIRSIISRRQFGIWAEGVNASLLRPYRQPTRASHNSSPHDSFWSIGDYLLRAYPKTLDRGYSATIYIDDRVPVFLTLRQLYPPPRDIVIQHLRLNNSDAWGEQQQGSRYVDFEGPTQLGWVWLDSDDEPSQGTASEGESD